MLHQFSVAEVQVSFINWRGEMNSNQVLLLLMMVCGVSCLSLPRSFEKKSDVTRFRVEISESGTKFSEELEVDTKENTEVYHVPQHNNVDQSDILHMFAFNLTIYRFPLKGVCYVAPLKRDQPSPKKLVNDMSQVNNNYTYGTEVQSSSYRITGRVQDFQVWNTRIQSFCRGLEVYHVEVVDKNSVTIGSQDEQADRERRQTNSVRGGRCPPSQSNLACPQDKMFRMCYISGHTCAYYRKCKYVYDQGKEKLVTVCDYIHISDEMVCCTTKCEE